MNADKACHQRIGRLTPLADVFSAIAEIAPVTPRDVALADARGGIVATDIAIAHRLPAGPLALRDGWAVDAEATRDAGPYAPLTLQPSPQRVEAFAALPAGTDAVASLDSVTAIGDLMQIMAPAASGENVLPPGADAQQTVVLRKAGSQLRARDCAVLAAAGMKEVSIRQPRVCVVNRKPGDVILDAAAALVAHFLRAEGATVASGSELDDMPHRDADAIIGIGGTGEGRGDDAVLALSRVGTVTCHGIGLAPGESAAFGFIGHRPVLLMPGRMDAVLACWLVLGRRLIAQLSGAGDDSRVMRSVLARKVTSSVGIAELVLLRRDGDRVAPLASGYLPLQSLAQSDGWMLVPAESEGYPAGTEIEMRPLP